MKSYLLCFVTSMLVSQMAVAMNEDTRRSSTTFTYALRILDRTMVNSMLYSGWDPNGTITADGQTMTFLAYAAKCQSPEMMRVLLSHGASVSRDVSLRVSQWRNRLKRERAVEMIFDHLSS